MKKVKKAKKAKKDKIPRSATRMVDLILNTPALLDAVREDPEAVLQPLAERMTHDLPPPPLVRSEKIYILAVGSLGVVVVGAVVGAILITLLAQDGASIHIPEALTALGAAAIGALAGLLVPPAIGGVK